MTAILSRRNFLQSAAVSAGVALTIGFDSRGALALTAPTGGNITPFVRIAPDGTVTAIIKHFEGGQGTATGLSALIAEEMNMNLSDIAFEMAPADKERYMNTAFGVQGTGGSTAIANSFIQYRTAAAAAREVLISAASEEWGVPATGLELKDGLISGGGRTGNIGAFVDAAAAMEVPKEPRLKDPSEWRVIGVDQTGRLDTSEKIDGSAVYSMDVQLDNQMVVAIKRTPRLGGLVRSFDDSAAKQIPGFIMARQMPNNKGVMAYAETTWAAFKARDALKVDWDFSKAESRSTGELKAELLAMVNRAPEFQASEVDLATTSAALESAAQIVEREFYLPPLAHGPMEVLGGTIEPVAGGGVTVHAGAQMPTAAHGVTSQVLQLPPEKVQVNTLYAGGFFGRRATADADFWVELGLAFAVTDRTRPVKLQWSREDDITGGYYRPAFAHKVRVGLDQTGNIVGWDHRLSGQAIFKGTAIESVMVHNGVDHASVEGVKYSTYQIPLQHIGLTDQKGATTANWWRSVGNSHTAYVMECMMDLCAKAAGRDPVAYRLQYQSGDGADQRRMTGVIQLAAEKAGWGKPLAQNHFHGFAAHKSFGSYVAMVCEISTDSDGVVTIEKVTAAVDCGIAVNPDIIRAQIEGGIGYGIGHVMRSGITLKDGVVEQSNFHDFETLRITDLSHIETHIVPSTEAPTGVGEPGTPPAGPALANAIAASGVEMVTHLPMTENGVEFS